MGGDALSPLLGRTVKETEGNMTVILGAGCLAIGSGKVTLHQVRLTHIESEPLQK